MLKTDRAAPDSWNVTFLRVALALILFGFMTGCAMGAPAPSDFTAPPGDRSLETQTLAPSPTPTASPSASPTRRPTATASPMPMPTITPLATLDPTLLDRIAPQNVARLQPLRRIGYGWVYDLDWSDDGRLIAIGALGGTYVLDSLTLELAYAFEAGFNEYPYVASVKFRPATYLLFGGWFWRITVFNLYRGSFATQFDGLSGHFDFTPDGHLIAFVRFVSETEAHVVVYDVNTRELVFDQALDSEDRPIGDGRLVPGADRYCLVTWHSRFECLDLAGNAEPTIVTLSSRGLTGDAGMDVSPDGKTAAAGDMVGDVFLIDLADLSTRRLEPTHGSRITAVRWSNRGAYLAIGTLDGTITIWDPQSMSQVTTIETEQRAISEVSFSPDDQLLASIIGNGTIQIWEIPAGRLVASKPGFFLAGGAGSPFAISQDRTLLAGGLMDFGLVTVWDVESGSLLWSFGDQVPSLWSLAISPNNRYLASASFRSHELAFKVRDEPAQKVVVWDLETGDVVFETDDLGQAVNFSPDGKSIFALDIDTRNCMRISVGSWRVGVASWSDCMKRKVLAPISGLNADSISCEYLSPDGQLAVRSDREALRFLTPGGDLVAEFLLDERHQSPCAWFDRTGTMVYAFFPKLDFIEIWAIRQGRP